MDALARRYRTRVRHDRGIPGGDPRARRERGHLPSQACDPLGMIVGLCVGCGVPKKLRSKGDKVEVHYDPFSELIEHPWSRANRLPILCWDTTTRALIWHKSEVLPEAPPQR